MIKDTSHSRCSQESNTRIEQWLSVLSLQLGGGLGTFMWVRKTTAGQGGRNSDRSVFATSPEAPYFQEQGSLISGYHVDRSEWGLSGPGDRTEGKT